MRTETKGEEVGFVYILNVAFVLNRFVLDRLFVSNFLGLPGFAKILGVKKRKKKMLKQRTNHKLQTKIKYKILKTSQIK